MTNVHDFGARGDGATDDTAALTHAIQRGDGHLVFPRGDYVISRPLHLPLQLHGRLGLDGSVGTAKIIMAGPGPALHLVGSHRRTALPTDFSDDVWRKERMPILRDLEIEGRHPQADGVRIEGIMQPTLSGVLIRKCRHGIYLANRARNVLIDGCHVYNNSGIGVFLDHVNLHQINIVGSHISYCKQAGIKIVASEVRNIQISGNDIEYNFDAKLDDCADVYFDCREGTVREGTIVGNTIQASGSPGGANIRLVGAKDHPNAVGLLAITGNLLGSQATVLELVACRGVVVSGNSIYSGYRHAIVAQDAEHIVLGANTIDHNPQYRGNSTDQIVLRRCRNVNITGLMMQHTLAATEAVEASIELHECRNVSVNGLQVFNARRRGLMLDGCTTVRVADCTVRGQAGDRDFRAALAVANNCREVMVVNNFLGRGGDGDFKLPAEIGSATGNVMI